VRRLALIVVVVAWGAAVGAAHAAGGDYYLALGDSLAAGWQSAPSVTGGGYPMVLTARLQAVDPGITLADLANPGETSSSFLGSQLAQADAFLRAHPGHVPFVTIDIGGNDIAGCGGSATCNAAALAAIDHNVPTIVAGLTAAAGPETRFAFMTYYDPFLEYWVTGAAGQTIAAQSVPVLDTLNARLVSDFGPGFITADVAGAFSAEVTGDDVSTLKHGTVPQDVAVICLLTGGCDYGVDVHANSIGHRLIADTFFAALMHRPAPPASLSAPGVSGRALRGHTLTETHGAWANSPASFAYQWEDCDPSGRGCVVINSATTPAYTVSATDAGHTIRVREAAANAHGIGATASLPTGMVPGIVTPSAARIRKVLGDAIAVRGKAARIGAILRANGETVPVRALVAGTAVLAWYSLAPARHGKGGHAGRVLLATGRLAFAAAGIGRLMLELTSEGRALLARARRVSLTATATFTPVARYAVLATGALTVRR
jgi:lysophospholipase L1-like esterase